ncbi:MAG: ribulose-phosphate 3-epimerase [Hungatella sp.]|nr:ribulose-phosphate 3-epimerase [Hungatella sp.]
MYILAPSLLGADFRKLEDEIRTVEQAGAGYLHLDVMDGVFVPSISFGMPVIAALRRCSGLTFDVHMMVEEPIRYVRDVREAGADLICVHAEACRHLDSTLEEIRRSGARVGVALNPATPISAVDLVLPRVDMVLVMTVNPGFGGQRLIPYTVEKVRGLRERIRELGLSTDIQVDGGVTPDNTEELLAAGANVVVAGSAVFRGEAGKNVKEFLDIFRAFQERAGER